MTTIYMFKNYKKMTYKLPQQPMNVYNDTTFDDDEKYQINHQLFYYGLFDEKLKREFLHELEFEHEICERLMSEIKRIISIYDIESCKIETLISERVNYMIEQFNQWFVNGFTVVLFDNESTDDDELCFIAFKPKK